MNLAHVRRLKAKLEGNPFIVVGQDGERKKISQADFVDNFLRNSERLRSHYNRSQGSKEEVPPPHPAGEALKGAKNPLPQMLQNAAEAQRKLDRQLEDESKQ